VKKASGAILAEGRCRARIVYSFYSSSSNVQTYVRAETFLETKLFGSKRVHKPALLSAQVALSPWRAGSPPRIRIICRHINAVVVVG